MKEMLIRVINVPEEDFVDVLSNINTMAKEECQMELNQTDLSMEIDYSLCKSDDQLGICLLILGPTRLLYI